MDSFFEFYDKHNKLVNLLILIIFLSLIGGIIYNYSKKTPDSQIEYDVEKIVLFGEKIIYLNEGDNYQEPGFYALLTSHEIKKNEVVVKSNLDTSKAGLYTITYSLGKVTVNRVINVLAKEELETSRITLTLKGESMIVLEVGEKYIEPGYIALDDNSIDVSEQVMVDGEVDSNTPGTYYLNYSIVDESGTSTTLTRQIIIKSSPVNADISKNIYTYTNQDIILTINVLGENFSYIRFPNNTISEDRNANYIISDNGVYDFYIYDKENNYIKKEININNIDKDNPTGSCSAKVSNGKTEFSVLASDLNSGVSSYNFYGNDTFLGRGGTTFTSNNIFTSTYVLVYDEAGNYTRINCSLEKQGELEVHFIDVGREDAIVIRDDSKVIFIDGGSYNKGSKITTYLKNLGVTHIDAIIGSHLHYNHIQAEAALLENFSVDKIYYGQDLKSCYSKYCDKEDQKYILDAIKKYNKKIDIMRVNDNFNIGDMNIFCIGPITFQTKSQSKYRQNYNSLNFILTYGKTKFMFTGDNVQYSNILNKFDESLLDIDVLKYPHHGNASLGKKFVNAITPKYVILTNSRDELSGRSEKTYLKNVGASFYYSYKHGNIVIKSDGENLTIKTNAKALDYKR